jgi:hypothetical protein
MKTGRAGVAALLLNLFTIAALLLTTVSYCLAEESKWQGVDKSVVEKIAKEQGRNPHPSLLNTDQGDLLLFLFLLAGAAGGFAAGYYWRTLSEQKKLCKGTHKT